jgi:adenylosuccinate lyase
MSYISPISTRYKAPITSSIWAKDNRVLTMRQLWIDLAFCQKELGINCIDNVGISELQNNKHIINYDVIDSYEEKFKHDIMAHLYAFSDLCPTGKNMIHLGATSNFINDNVDMILVTKSLKHIIYLLYKLIDVLKTKSINYKDVPTLAYTHLQSAQLITVGKRFTFWNSDIILDLDGILDLLNKLPFRGIKGTVGSEDTILKLFDGDHDKCISLNNKLAELYGFSNKLMICGQTYSRKYDLFVFQTLSSLCQSIYKMMNDIRLLSGKSEIYEHFSKDQIGSSAMPYKKNPITCEKICSLCRLVINHETNMSQTYINQWLERSLDDSAIKRIIYPDCFILTEHILNEAIKCIDNIYINIPVIEKNVDEHLHNIISEHIIIAGVKMGFNRQDIHERLRLILTATSSGIDVDFTSDDVLKRIMDENKISMIPSNYIGRCVEQIDTFYAGQFGI